MIIERVSPFTGEIRQKDLPITQEHIDAWEAGALIQDAFPHLTAGEREFIMTGITDEEWDDLFSDTEDEFEEDDNDVVF